MAETTSVRASSCSIVQYRGIPGNPDNAFSYKALFGDEDFKNEPNKTIRTASVRLLDSSRTYHWKATWSSGINVVVQGRPEGWEHDLRARNHHGGTYNPTPHVAYLGANNGGKCEEEGSWPGLTFSNVWIGNRPRPRVARLGPGGPVERPPDGL
jgi:hypothetical protein